MTHTFFSLEKMDALFSIDHGWLFDTLIDRLGTEKNAILYTEPGWEPMEYVNELGFQLAQKCPDIHCLYIDIKPFS